MQAEVRPTWAVVYVLFSDNNQLIGVYSTREGAEVGAAAEVSGASIVRSNFFTGSEDRSCLY